MDREAGLEILRARNLLAKKNIIIKKNLGKFQSSLSNEQYTTDVAEMDNMFIHLTNVAI